MNPGSVLPLVHRTITRNPALMGVAGAATGLMRQMAIKPYKPAARRRELALRRNFESIHQVHCRVYREKGSGSIPTIVLAGFVPDASEVAEFQRPLFKSYGDIYYVNYPRNGFSIEMLSAQLADLVEDLNKKGEKPVLFSISFGAGLLAAFLQSEFSNNLAIRGIVMASPVLCKEDLVRPKEERTGGVRMLESNLSRILKADPENPEEINRQIERARRCFQALFEAGAENRRLTARHLSIRRKIMNVVQKTTFMGGYQRVLALKDFNFPPGEKPLFSGPALILLAEAEENILVPTAPTLSSFGEKKTLERIFPLGTVRQVVSEEEGDPVVHASLIFHYNYYNQLMGYWYGRLHSPALLSAL